MPPTIDLFVTSILSNPAIRGRHERVRRGLTSIRTAFSEHDVAADEAAKSLWKRKARNGNELPFLLVDGEPVGSVEEFDEAVEFGELRQFLRLDGPAAPSAVTPPASSAESVAAAAGSAGPSGSSPTAAKPSIDDFASLSLSPSELDELSREIASGSTFSSGLGTLTPLDAPHASAAPLNFSHATRTIEPVLPPTAPLKFERVNFTRPLPDRPLASDVARDELEGIETDELGEDELDKLARELEEEEEERRRLRDAQGSSRVEPPPLPEKPASDEPAAAAPVPTKLADPPVPPKLPAELASATAVGGAGGAALSAPLADVATLRLSPHEQAALASPPSPGGATLEVQPVSALERAGPLPEQGDGEDAAAPSGATAAPQRTSRREADEIRAELNLEGARGGPAKVSEMPHFGVQDLSPPPPPPPPPPPSHEEGAKDGDELVENVAAAIRGGDL